MKSSEAITLLKKHHSFPGLYIFKLIGENTSNFYEDVLLEVSKELGEMMDLGERLSTRESSGGSYVSITLSLEMESAEQVLRLYERFSKLKGLRSMM
ncbi:MAG: DUF493 family protein [Proteobacteria bacterium]|nr:DUF493 family protein [Pseudomonadota bacterium]NIS71458.1 DUF493 family protein [Pseudomonadota bacterium]